MKEKVNKNTKENKKYKITILKIYARHAISRNTMENIIIAKIKTHDIIKSIDNLEYLELTKLNLPEDESFLKYGKDVVIKNYYEFIKGDDYKKAIRYLKDNDIDEKLIKKLILTIYDYLNSEYKDNLKKFKKMILELEESVCKMCYKNE